MGRAANMPGLADLAKMKSELAAGNTTGANDTLAQLKIKIAVMPAAERMTPAALTEEREVYECAVLLSAQSKDTAEFERHMALLTPYYSDFGALLAPSENHFPILGLNLLRLLAQNRIADFHSQLETMSPEALSSTPVQFPVLLEQNMMEGSYTKVLEMRNDLPLPSYGVFMDMLKDAVREEVASVSEKAYKSLPKAYCMKVLMMTDDGELADYAESRGWEIKDSSVLFDIGSEQKKEVPAMETISEMLFYAKELERIV